MVKDHEADEALGVLEAAAHHLVQLLQVGDGRGGRDQLVPLQVHLSLVHGGLQLFQVFVKLLLQVLLLHRHLALIGHDEFKLDFFHTFFAVFKLDLHLLLLVFLLL